MRLHRLAALISLAPLRRLLLLTLKRQRPFHSFRLLIQRGGQSQSVRS
jgi:hypothetical protein